MTSLGVFWAFAFASVQAQREPTRGSGHRAYSFSVRRNSDKVGWTLIALALAVPLLQLVPLPPPVWRLIPAQAAVLPTLQLVGVENSWRPLSLFPSATFAAFLALIPGLAMVVLTARLRVDRRWIAFAAFAVLTTASAIVGLIQFAGGSSTMRFYSYTNLGFATGFFANRNAAVDFFSIGLLSIGALYLVRRDLFERAPVRLASFTGIALLLLAILATGSRAGIALAVVPLAFFVHAFVSRKAGRSLRAGNASPLRPVLTASLGVLTLAAAGVAALHYTALRSVGARFAMGGGERTTIWNDTIVAISAAMPIGTGFGTFVPVYATIEALDGVNERHVNRAHNDYLEVLLEGGAPAVALVLAFLFYIVVCVLREWRSPDSVRRTSGAFVACVTLVVALHSLVDYPLRSLTLMTVAGFALGLLFTGRQEEPALDKA